MPATGLTSSNVIIDIIMGPGPIAAVHLRRAVPALISLYLSLSCSSLFSSRFNVYYATTHAAGWSRHVIVRHDECDIVGIHYGGRETSLPGAALRAAGVHLSGSAYRLARPSSLGGTNVGTEWPTKNTRTLEMVLDRNPSKSSQQLRLLVWRSSTREHYGLFGA